MREKNLQGLSRLEEIVDDATYLVLLRELYYMVFSTSRRHGMKKVFQRRLRQFERDCDLPAYLSTLPFTQLLEELDDAQYLYPISEREITFPSFI